MYKLSIILADSDDRYIDKAAAYINSNYRSRIKLTCFTRVDAMEQYLSNLTDKVDVVLANPMFLNLPAALYDRVMMLIPLCDGSITYTINTISINKYQPGDVIVSQLLDLYAQKCGNAASLINGSSDTKIVSVYSPTGGTGKTSLSMGLASMLRDRDKKVLCLSLESINSLVSGLNCIGTEALSHLMLSLMENEGLLPIKLEMHKTRDSFYDFDFIEPPGCFTELSELKLEDLEKLLFNLKDMGKYDYIIVDMDSTADLKVIVTFSASDKIVFICGHDEMARFKTKSFLNQLHKMTSTDDMGLLEKFVPIINKSNEGSGDLEHCGLKICCVVPFVRNLWVYDGTKNTFDISRGFTDSLAALEKFIG